MSANAPSEKWLTDVAELQVPAGKVYRSPLIDCLDGMVVSWSIGTRPDAERVNQCWSRNRCLTRPGFLPHPPGPAFGADQPHVGIHVTYKSTTSPSPDGSSDR